MELKINYLFLFFLLTSSLWSISKEDKIILSSLYPYTVKGITYYPHKVSVGKTKTIKASWYGEYFHGRKTANGEIYDMYGYTAAHKTYPLGTVLLVTNPKNGKSLRVRVNDRGPFWNNRELDLSMGAAEYLGTKREGVAKVKIRVISVPDIVQYDFPIEGEKVIKPSYNIGLSAISYSSISKSSKKVPFEIGIFKNKKEAENYRKKLSKEFPKTYVFKDNYNYKVKFFLSSKERLAIKRLKKLKKLGLITGYGLCWTYD